MKKLSLPLRLGLITGFTLIAYFLVLALVNKHTNPAFSFFNAFITAVGIYEVVKFKKQEDEINFDYGEAFKFGIITGFIATIIFSVFFLVYSTEINPGFLPELINKMHATGLNANVGMVTSVVAIMGFATSVVTTLTVMQLFKKSKNLVENH
ncbi:DUF4199 domain-containing protein [Neotamlana laminarinivorans]|uniref:DUF4199 domain-containing protein n=1 Tax=Neotamlana laminarinivorans TaxID=2883124 RepID=A0A9X1L2G8_9FLAO|nr:DUF4199 domain-containing protein [Tamlana laminarinivorans]MCB4799768.1 DUF4199 domain-containing protein [Tamlana laminarinivorans]